MSRNLSERSDRQDAVLAPGAWHGLGRGHLEAAPDGVPGVSGVDDVIDLRVTGSDVRVDVLAELLGHGDARLVTLFALGDLLELLAHRDVDHSVGTHHRDLRRPPDGPDSG